METKTLLRKKLSQRRRRLREKKKIFLNTLSEEDRRTFISKEKIIKEKTYEDSQIHLQKCYERSDAANCYRFCFNCSFNDCMTRKEQSSLMTQLSYAYSSLRNNTDVQIQYHITSATNFNGKKALVQNYDISPWKVVIHHEPFYKVFESSKIVVLSPDAEKELQTMDVDTVYVIGGLVDRTVLKNQTYEQARHLNLTLRSLPLKTNAIRLTNPVLNINTVTDILREYIRSSNWKKSFLLHIPQRKQGLIGPRASRKSRFLKKKQEYQDIEAMVIKDLNSLVKTPELDNDSQTSETYIQLPSLTITHLDYLYKYFQHKSKKHVNVSHDTGKNRCNNSSWKLSGIPDGVNSCGLISVNHLKHWLSFLNRLKNERTVREENSEKTYDRNPWWESDQAMGDLRDFFLSPF